MQSTKLYTAGWGSLISANIYAATGNIFGFVAFLVVALVAFVLDSTK